MKKTMTNFISTGQEITAKIDAFWLTFVKMRQNICVHLYTARFSSFCRIDGRVKMPDASNLPLRQLRHPDPTARFATVRRVASVSKDRRWQTPLTCAASPITSDPDMLTRS